MDTRYHVEYDYRRQCYWLVRTEVPRWAIAVSRLVDHLDAATGHWLCGEGVPEWLTLRPLEQLFDRLFLLDDLLAREVARNTISADSARRLGWEHL